MTISLRRHHAASTSAHTWNVRQFHQPFNAFLIHAKPYVTKLSLHTVASIGSIAHDVNLANMFRHDSSLDAALTGGT